MNQIGKPASLLGLQEEQQLVNQLLRSHIDKTFHEISNNIPNMQQALFNPLRGFLLRGGKRIRPIMMRQCCRAVGGKEELGELCLIPELIHSGTLIIDDIEDGSQLRRGKPALHTQIGVDLAINAGNYLYFCYHSLLEGLDAEKQGAALSLITQEMERLHRGQAMDIYWHQGSKGRVLPSADDYLEMCRLKTGTMMRLSAKLGALLGGGTEAQVDALGRYAERLGGAFQIKDDILNVRPTKQWGKEYGEDIREGKRTLLVIHTTEVASPHDRTTLRRILNNHTSKRGDIENAVALFEKYNSFEHAEETASSLVSQGLVILKENIPPGNARQNLEQLGEFFLTRAL